MSLPSIEFHRLPVLGETEESRRGTWRENWMTSPADRSAILSLLRTIKPKIVVEIGVNSGYTAKMILENLRGIQCYKGVEVTPQYQTTLPIQQTEIPSIPGEMALSDPRFELLLRSRGSFDLTPEEIGPCDAMLIDGDHSRNAVLNDTSLARLCVRKDGLIIWHDYYEGDLTDVKNTLEEFAARGAEIKHIEGTWVAFERVS